MSELFPAYIGEMLTVSDMTDSKIARLLPEIDRKSFYRSMDAYLLTCPPSKYPKNMQLFVWKNAKREKVCTLRAAEALARKYGLLGAEIHAGAGPDVNRA